MSKITFLYCTGTAFALAMFDNAFHGASVSSFKSFWGDYQVNPDKQVDATKYVAGLNGKTYPWDGEVFNDPFPFMLDTDIWNPVRVSYNDSEFTILSGGEVLGGMGASINDGVSKVIAQINNLPAGAPFAIGGYSQGAAGMSEVYNQIRTGSLTSRASSFLGGVCFGNPRRQVNFRGEVGGTWSGAWDDPNKGNTGGHGSFPATGPWARLSGCDGTKWIEFANPNDIITSTGDSSTGTLWTQGNDALLGLLYSQFGGQAAFELILSLIPGIGSSLVGPIMSAVQTAVAVAGVPTYLKDVAGSIFSQAGAGHITYPYLPPADSSTGAVPKISTSISTTYTTSGSTTSVVGATSRVGRLRGVGAAAPPVTITHDYFQADPSTDTCYQIALKWLEGKASSYATAPIVMPSTGTAGWSTTLIPPSS